MQGKRHLTAEVKQQRDMVEKARNFRLDFLRTLKPTHPLYASSEARAARGETEE